jgi:Protein of unknown function (DUF1588)
MMKQTLGLLVLGTATLACSGRYYEVGGMDGAGGAGSTGAAAGGAAPGGTSSSTAGSPEIIDPGAGAAAGSGSAGPSMPAPQCVPNGAPPKLTGTFAEPQEVWRRIAMLSYGTPTLPPSDLPATTTYAWAGGAVALALADAKETLASAPGVELFLRQALGLDATATFMQHWDRLASTNTRLLNALLSAPLGEPGRVGIFTEPSWLVTKTTISSRGAAIERALFGVEVPAPPVNIQNPEPDPIVQDRAALESALANPACAACHQIIDPTGFALGHFAADGSYRELDHGLAIDATGLHYGNSQTGETVKFDGIADFGQKFADSCDATRGIAATFLRAALVINEAPEAMRAELLAANQARVEQAFVNGPRTYESLLKAYIQSPAGLRP